MDMIFLIFCPKSWKKSILFELEVQIAMEVIYTDHDRFFSPKYQWPAE
jgi:hypothetical protein